MKLKGLKKVNKVVNKFTKQFGVRAELGTKFQAYCDEMIINYTLTCDADEKYYFIQDAEERYPYIKADIFLWYLMHEIGHCITDNFWTETEQEYFMAQKDAMCCIVDDDLRNDWYHACPDEFFATKWAGNYMTKHPKKMTKFWNKLQVAIIQMYKKNDLI